jgi:glutamate-1-semialdehyde 2,1-aminomutase
MSSSAAAVVSVNSHIVRAYLERTPGSAALAQQAHLSLPSGITHDSRYLEPYGLYVERAAGAHKWDVDGHRLVDYFGGHGALLLGHNHPDVIARTQQALSLGTHFGAGHPGEVAWAEKICSMVPCAQKVRFTSSGTEATHMALRLARAHTGRAAVLRFRTHFHGWHDHMASGVSSHFDGTATPGVVNAVANDIILVDPNDEAGVSTAFDGDRPIAAVIIEPTGSGTGMVPTDGQFLRFLRDITSRHGTVLIFDEVVTGFRVSRGGAQAHYEVTPDLATFAKIIAGGLPGGCVAGREDIIEWLDFEVAKKKGFDKIGHQGTYNANPVSAAAGLATLELIESTDACDRANVYGDRLRARLNEVLAEEQVPWAAYGQFSAFHLFTNPDNRPLSPGNTQADFDPATCHFDELRRNAPGVVQKLRLALILNGVDITGWPGGTISAMHSDDDMDHTINAFREALRMMRLEDAL